MTADARRTCPQEPKSRLRRWDNRSPGGSTDWRGLWVNKRGWVYWVARGADGVGCDRAPSVPWVTEKGGEQRRKKCRRVVGVSVRACMGYGWPGREERLYYSPATQKQPGCLACERRLREHNPSPRQLRLACLESSGSPARPRIPPGEFRSSVLETRRIRRRIRAASSTSSPRSIPARRQPRGDTDGQRRRNALGLALLSLWRVKNAAEKTTGRCE